MEMSILAIILKTYKDKHEHQNTLANFISSAMSAHKSNVKARNLWIEADKPIKESGFKASYLLIKEEGGVDFAHCVETWFNLGLGSKSDSVSKFWNR